MGHDLTLVTVSYLVYFETLLQNTTDLLQNTKANAKCKKKLLQISQILYYKIRQSLQNATFVTKCTITVIINS